MVWSDYLSNKDVLRKIEKNTNKKETVEMSRAHNEASKLGYFDTHRTY